MSEKSRTERTLENERRARQRAGEKEKKQPKILDQWGIIDKWWTSEREQKVFMEIQVDDQKCTLRYDVQTKIFSIQEKTNGE